MQQKERAGWELQDSCSISSSPGLGLRQQQPAKGLGGGWDRKGLIISTVRLV